MAWMNLSLHQFGKGAAASFLRFPLALLAAIAGTWAMTEWVSVDYQQKEKFEYLLKLVWFSWLGLVLFVVLQLASERYRLSQVKRLGLYAIGLALLAAYYVLLPADLQVRHYLQLFLLGLGLHLAVSYVWFLNRAPENSFWQFNERLFLRFLTAALYSGVLYVGLAIAIVAIDNLFELKINDRIYARLWFFMAGVFNTWFFLAGVPASARELETETTYPKGLKVFTQFVLLPLVTVYLLILYGYLGKILIEWEWPRGWVSNLVLGFSVVGIFSLLLIHPIRHLEGNHWIRTFGKWFYRALFPLLVLLGLAIWRRIRDYGITEERYFVLILAFWLLLIAVYFLFSRQKNIKIIPVTLSLLAFLAAFGPWGAFAVSERSQTSRLTAYLTKNNLIGDNKLQKTSRPIPLKDEAEISSILEYLGRMHEFESIDHWFGADLKKKLAKKTKYPYMDAYGAETVMKNLGLQYRSRGYQHQDPDQKDFNFDWASEKLEVIAVKDYDFLLEFSSQHGKQDEFTIAGQPFLIKYQDGERRIKLEFRNKTAEIDLVKLQEKLKDIDEQDPDPAEMTYLLTLGGARVKVEITHLNGRKQKKATEIYNVEGRILVKLTGENGSGSGN